MSKIEVIDNSVLKDIINCANEVFCRGIYVPCNSRTDHPCGWDFISFEYMGSSPLTYEFESDDISNGIYNEHDFEDKTLKEILELTQGRYAFEVSGIDW